MATPPTATGTLQGTPLRTPEEKDQPLGRFRIQGKYIHRASIVALKMGEKADGTPNIVNQPGPMELLEVGTELDDVQEHELKAFPDRFEPLDAQAKKTVLRLRGIPEEAQEHEDVDDLLAAPMPLGTPSSPADKDEPPQPVEPSPAEKAMQAEERRKAAQSRQEGSSAPTRRQAAGEHPQGGPPGQTGEHPEHPHGGPPGQTGEHPQGGAPGQTPPPAATPHAERTTTPPASQTPPEPPPRQPGQPRRP